MGRRRSAALLKQITDRGIDEVQRVPIFCVRVRLWTWEAFISLSRKSDRPDRTYATEEDYAAKALRTG
jgi:hypothetical protein